MNINELLVKIVEAIDLTPNDIQEAQSKRLGLENYFLNQQQRIKVYTQGSFSYGTQIKPLKIDRDGDFDLDLVCEVEEDFIDPEILKNYIGDIIKKSHYSKYLEKEGKRCWTLDYDRFHIDLLPSIHDSINAGTFIKITNKDKESLEYTFKSSNPKGLTKWFLEINDFHFSGIKNNKKSIIYEKNKIFFMESMKYNSWNEVEDIFVSSPLQNAVKILKRHRDQMYINTDKEDFKPISVIITVLVGNIFSNNKQEKNINIVEIINRFISESDRYINYQNNQWIITNPSNSKENLADRWTEQNSIRYKEFIRWKKSLREFIGDLTEQNDKNSIISKYFGPEVTASVQSSIDRDKPAKITNPNIKPWNKHV